MREAIALYVARGSPRELQTGSDGLLDGVSGNRPATHRTRGADLSEHLANRRGDGTARVPRVVVTETAKPGLERCHHCLAARNQLAAHRADYSSVGTIASGSGSPPRAIAADTATPSSPATIAAG